VNETAHVEPATTAVASSPPTGRPPYLSVVVMAYRRRRFLRGAIESVLDQTLPRSAFEVIVLKDFADPELDAWIASLRPSVRCVTEDLPLMGQMIVRGVELAQGEVVSFLDDDDRFRPEKLAGLAALFREDPSLGFVRNAYEPIDGDGRRLPDWERTRPQAPVSQTWRPGARPFPYAWVHRYGGYVNVSTMALRTSVARRWVRWITPVPASPDVFLFTVALASDVGVRVERSRWTQYRVHASTSHPAMSEASGTPDAPDFRRAQRTSELLRAAVASAPGHPVAVRVSEAWGLETSAVLFLLDPTARFSLTEWMRLGVSALRRRQVYLVTIWLFCVFRAMNPAGAARAYQARRQRELRRTTSVGPSASDT
jgi:Glycosyl transferase family 2